MFCAEEYQYDELTAEELDIEFKAYCEWCWGHGFGNCDVCRQQKDAYKERLLKINITQSSDITNKGE